MHLFEQQGIESLSIAEIQKKLDISEATFQSFFKDKEDMLVQAYLQRLEDDKLDHQKIAKAAANPVEQIFEMIELGSQRLTTISPAFISDVVRHPAILELARKNSDGYSYPLVYGILNRGVVEGYFRKDINLGIVTKVILENIYLLLNTQVFPPNAFSSREIFRNIYLYYLRGLCTKEHIDMLDKYFS